MDFSQHTIDELRAIWREAFDAGEPVPQGLTDYLLANAEYEVKPDKTYERLDEVRHSRKEQRSAKNRQRR